MQQRHTVTTSWAPARRPPAARSPGWCSVTNRSGAVPQLELGLLDFTYSHAIACGQCSGHQPSLCQTELAAAAVLPSCTHPRQLQSTNIQIQGAAYAALRTPEPTVLPTTLHLQKRIK